MFFLFSYFSFSQPFFPLKNSYDAVKSAREIYDIRNFDEFTINVVKEFTVVTIPDKRHFSAVAYDENGSELAFDSKYSFYKFDFGNTKGKIVIKKLSRQSILPFRIAVQTEDPSFKSSSYNS